MRGHDLVGLGEVMLRLAAPPPRRLEQTSALDVQIGGAEANVAAACARLGLRAAWLSALPANPWGERIRRELTAHGVDCGQVRMLADARVGVYFLEFGAAPRASSVIYDRKGAAIANIKPGMVPWAKVFAHNAEDTCTRSKPGEAASRNRGATDITMVFARVRFLAGLGPKSEAGHD